VKGDLGDELDKGGDPKIGTLPLPSHVAHLGGGASIPRGMTRPLHLPFTCGDFLSHMCSFEVE
jgi:hypothetical protein